MTDRVRVITAAFEDTKEVTRFDSIWWDNPEVPFSTLIGKTLISAEVGATILGDDQICFKTSDGEVYVMLHKQDCCESVSIDDICGDLGSLIGDEILLAEETTSEDHPYFQNSSTWTFYHLRTVHSTVTIRWYGTSNGCYSERVSLIRLEGDHNEI